MQPRIAAVQKVMSKEGEINKRYLAECRQKTSDNGLQECRIYRREAYVHDAPPLSPFRVKSPCQSPRYHPTPLKINKKKEANFLTSFIGFAESEGFEPPVRRNAYTAFRVRLFRPLRQLSLAVCGCKIIKIFLLPQIVDLIFLYSVCLAPLLLGR